jgi:methylase of polypeptide subunit release factors
VKSLELGSGTGLLGLFTISRLLKDNTNSSIIMTDIEDSSIDLIK